jgi:hypothetical protein
LIAALTLVITVSLGTAACLVVLNDVKSRSNLRAVFSALIPARAGGGAAPCH